MSNEWASLTVSLTACFMIFSINMIILIVGIFVNRGGSLHYGGIIKIETDSWAKRPVTSLETPSILGA